MVTAQRTDSHPVKLTDLSPLPLSGVARKQRQSGPKTILLTGSPYKKVLEEKQLKKGKAALKRSSTKATCKNPPKKMNKGKSKKTVDTDSEEEDPYCIVCCERFSRSKSRETWVACVACKGWAHLDCTQNEGKQYVCHHCDSDDDDD